MLVKDPLYQKMLKENIWPSVYALKFKHTWVMQQDDDEKPARKSTSGCLKIMPDEC